mmetsp:Transcript_45699/g.145818  ORF Transcript_45699/g.145818 Transcript_45699/m.145818 type:complete len:218 (+) Transcript_45699:971-1624(+)
MRSVMLLPDLHDQVIDRLDARFHLDGILRSAHGHRYQRHRQSLGALGGVLLQSLGIFANLLQSLIGNVVEWQGVTRIQPRPLCVSQRSDLVPQPARLLGHPSTLALAPVLCRRAQTGDRLRAIGHRTGPRLLHRSLVLAPELLALGAQPGLELLSQGRLQRAPRCVLEQLIHTAVLAEIADLLGGHARVLPAAAATHGAGGSVEKEVLRDQTGTGSS